MFQALHIHLSDALLVLGDLCAFGRYPRFLGSEVLVIECALQHLLTGFLQVLIELIPPVIYGLQGRVSLLHNDPLQLVHSSPRRVHFIIVEIDLLDDRQHEFIDVLFPRRALRALLRKAAVVDMPLLLIRRKRAATGTAQHAPIYEQLSRRMRDVLPAKDGLNAFEKL